MLLDIHGRAPGTSDKIAQALSRVFRFALGRGYIEANPLEAARAALPRDFGSRARKAQSMVPIADLRAAFKTWSQDHTIDPALAERALGHAVRGDVQQAYDRSTMIQKRRRLMEQWAGYLTGAGKGQVVQLAEHRA